MEGHYRDSRGKIPRSTIVEERADGHRWLRLNDIGMEISESAYAYKGTKAEARDEPADPVTGSLQRLEWGAVADWFDPTAPWRTFIPKSSPRRFEWYLAFDKRAPVHIAPSSQDDILNVQIIPYIADRISADLNLAYRCVRGIATAIDYPSYAPLPTHWTATVLKSAFGTKSGAAAAMGQARRAMVDCLAWIAWCLTLHDLRDYNIPTDIVHAVTTTFGIPGTMKRGVLIDLISDADQINLPLLVANDVPVTYPWGLAEKLVPRLMRLSPEWLGTYDVDSPKRGERRPSRGEVHDRIPDAGTAAFGGVSPNQYDDFLQRVNSNARPGIQLPSGEFTRWTTFVVDFERWAPRMLTDTKLITEYLENYSFTEFLTADGGMRYIHRFNPVTPTRASPEEEAIAARHAFWQEERRRSAIVREFGRFKYAPSSSEGSWQPAAGDDTSMLRHSPMARASSSSPDSENGRRASRSASSASTRSERRAQAAPYSLLHRMEGASSGATNGTPLAQRLSGADDSDSVTAIEPSNDGEDEGDESGQDLDGFWLDFIDHYARDRPSSPEQENLQAAAVVRNVVVIEGEDSEDEEQPLNAAMTYELVRTTVAPRTFPPPFLPIDPAIEWGDKYLAVARLRLPDPSVEMKMRHWVLSSNAGMDLSDVLRRAVERCMEFSVEIPVVETTAFRPLREAMTQMELAANIWYDSPDIDFTYDPKQDNFRLRTSYISIVTGLLARPHARAFIFKGGIYARLAREFGGDNLLRRAFEGPSVQVTWHLRGRVSRTNSDTMDDVVSEPEEWMLLGRVKSAGKRTSDRWLWPPPKMLKDYWLWSGEWDDETEQWFQRYLDHFRQGRVWPKTEGQWRQYLQHEQPTPASLPLSTAGWTELKQKLDRHDTAWKDQRIVDIVEIV